MARVDPSDVTAAIQTSVDDLVVLGFIDDASAWVDAHLSGAGLSDAVLASVEKYLACHFVTLRDPRLRSAQVGDVSETYQRDTIVTEYLKAAAAMDPTGTVREAFIAPKPHGRIRVRVGTGYAE